MADLLATIKKRRDEEGAHRQGCTCDKCWLIARVEELERRLVEQREQAHG